MQIYGTRICYICFSRNQLHLRYGWRHQGPCGSGWATLYLWSVAPRAGHAPRWPGNAKAPPSSWLLKRRIMPMSSRWKHTNVYEPRRRTVTNPQKGVTDLSGRLSSVARGPSRGLGGLHLPGRKQWRNNRDQSWALCGGRTWSAGGFRQHHRHDGGGGTHRHHGVPGQR